MLCTEKKVTWQAARVPLSKCQLCTQVARFTALKVLQELGLRCGNIKSISVGLHTCAGLSPRHVGERQLRWASLFKEKCSFKGLYWGVWILNCFRFVVLKLCKQLSGLNDYCLRTFFLVSFPRRPLGELINVTVETHIVRAIEPIKKVWKIYNWLVSECFGYSKQIYVSSHPSHNLRPLVL